MPTENLISEEILPYFGFAGHVHMYEGISTANAPARSPASNIQTDQPCHLLFHWRTTGNLNYIMDGKWICRVYLEKMGGSEFSLPSTYSIHKEDFVSRPNFYSGHVDIPPNVVPPGVYRLVATLTMEGNTGVPAPLAAFADLGMVQFYKEGV